MPDTNRQHTQPPADDSRPVQQQRTQKQAHPPASGQSHTALSQSSHKAYGQPQTPQPAPPRKRPRQPARVSNLHSPGRDGQKPQQPGHRPLEPDQKPLKKDQQGVSTAARKRHSATNSTQDTSQQQNEKSNIVRDAMTHNKPNADKQKADNKIFTNPAHKKQNSPKQLQEHNGRKRQHHQLKIDTQRTRGCGSSKDIPSARERDTGPAPLEAAPAAATAGQRLNKAIAASGFCSRRRADEYILSNAVMVNSQLENNPARRVLPSDRITVNGTVLSSAQEYCYLLLHKPVHTVCTVRDPQGRPTVMDLLPEEFKSLRLYPVGRLDYFSEGLLLLTNDGELAMRLTHPRHHQPKHYAVLVRGTVSESALAVMRGGMRLEEGDVLQPVDVEPRPTQHGNTVLRMVLRQGVNRQIRRMCRDLHITILRLRRVAQGPIELGELKAGDVRRLDAQEVQLLRRSVGLE